MELKALEILKFGVKLMSEELERNPATIEYIDNEINIYNEAITELEALQNRSCESCKYSEFDAVFQVFYSSNESIFCKQCSNNFTNKWEIKI